jgi:hypothetical protein
MVAMDRDIYRDFYAQVGNICVGLGAIFHQPKQLFLIY